MSYPALHGQAPSFMVSNPASTELCDELLGDRSGQRVRNDVHVLLHRLPRLRFFRIALGVQLLDLLDVMSAVRQQQSVDRVEWQVGIGPAQEPGDLRCVSGQGLDRRLLSRGAACDGRLEVLLYRSVV